MNRGGFEGGKGVYVRRRMAWSLRFSEIACVPLLGAFNADGLAARNAASTRF